MTFDEWWEYLESQDKKKVIAGLRLKDDIKELLRATWNIAKEAEGIEVKDLQEGKHDQD